MKTLGKSADVKTYSGAGHAFASPNNKPGYRLEAAAGRMVPLTKFYAQSNESKF